MLAFGGGSEYGKSVRKLGQMSSYIRKQQSVLRSQRGSINLGTGQGAAVNGPVAGGLQFGAKKKQKNEFDSESHNQRMFSKYMIKN